MPQSTKKSSITISNSQIQIAAKKTTEQPNIIWLMAEDISLGLEC